MNDSKLVITPKTKVGELLDAYPQLEETLLKLSPSFEKLKNPVLRKTVAKIASLQQAAAIGGIKVDEMVNTLRKAVGQSAFSGEIVTGENTETNVPDWFAENKITQIFDAIPVINSGGHPMQEVISHTQALNDGEIMELKTPFVPAPIIDMLKGKGFKVYSKNSGEEFFTYFCK